LKISNPGPCLRRVPPAHVGLGGRHDVRSRPWPLRWPCPLISFSGFLRTFLGREGRTWRVTAAPRKPLECRGGAAWCHRLRRASRLRGSHQAAVPTGSGAVRVKGVTRARYAPVVVKNQFCNAEQRGIADLEALYFLSIFFARSNFALLRSRCRKATQPRCLYLAASCTRDLRCSRKKFPFERIALRGCCPFPLLFYLTLFSENDDEKNNMENAAALKNICKKNSRNGKY
jgi:hypothetical protein